MILTVYPVDESKNHIVISTNMDYFLLSKVWFKLLILQMVWKVKSKLFERQKYLSFRSIILEFGFLTSLE